MQALDRIGKALLGTVSIDLGQLLSKRHGALGSDKTLVVLFAVALFNGNVGADVDLAAAKTAMDAIKTDAELDKEEENKPSEPENLLTGLC